MNWSRGSSRSTSKRSGLPRRGRASGRQPRQREAALAALEQQRHRASERTGRFDRKEIEGVTARGQPRAVERLVELLRGREERRLGQRPYLAGPERAARMLEDAVDRPARRLVGALHR